jgi:hypothetical protein
MRQAEASGWIVQNPSRMTMRALRLAAIVLGIGLVMSANAARAQDDDEDDSTFEEKIIKQIMTGIGGTNMENTGIEYRERSPLVIPPRSDLPPPAAAAAAPAPNWPKDPDIQKRKAAGRHRQAARRKPISPAIQAPTRSSARRSSATTAASWAFSRATRPRAHRSRANRRAIR